MPELLNSANDWLKDLAKRMQEEINADAVPTEEKLTVRQFLGQFGYYRRGPNVVSMIRSALESHGLRTTPDFEYEYVDDYIAVELDVNVEAIAADKNLIDPTVRIGILPAAHHPPVRVAPNHPIVKATTLMRMEDYSQLPVMTSEREVKGVISWRSIGEAYSDQRNPKMVQECMENAHEVDTNMMLADATERICSLGYVLVRGEDNVITGIVTAADLANQFKQRAHPFLLIGEIEHHLRNLVRRKFTRHEFAEASDGSKPVSGPDDLTFGGYCRLLEKKKSWNKLELNIDQSEFVQRLNSIRRIRNEVMHFSPDEHEPADIELLGKVAHFFRKLARLKRSDA